MSIRNRSFKSLATAMAASVCAVTLSPLGTNSASAHDGRWHDGERHPYVYRYDDRRDYRYKKPRRHHAHRHHKKHREHRRSDRGDVAAAAVIGIIGGAIIAGALSQNSPRSSAAPAPRSAYPPAPKPRQVTTRYSGTASLEPWTAGWHSWCNNRYRSFNAQTGTYRGYDGKDHFCVPK